MKQKKRRIKVSRFVSFKPNNFWWRRKVKIISGEDRPELLENFFQHQSRQRWSQRREEELCPLSRYEDTFVGWVNLTGVTFITSILRNLKAVPLAELRQSGKWTLVKAASLWIACYESSSAHSTVSSLLKTVISYWMPGKQHEKQGRLSTWQFNHQVYTTNHHLFWSLKFWESWQEDKIFTCIIIEWAKWVGIVRKGKNPDKYVTYM